MTYDAGERCRRKGLDGSVFSPAIFIPSCLAANELSAQVAYDLRPNLPKLASSASERRLVEVFFRHLNLTIGDSQIEALNQTAPANEFRRASMCGKL